MKVLYKFSAVLCVLAMMVAAVVQASAAMVFDYEGYSYTMINNYYISLVGWDNRSPELVVPDSLNGRYIRSVGNYAFLENTEITSVDFSAAEHLQRIGMSAFQGCSGLNQELIIPESVTAINDAAFQGCSSLPSLVDNSQATEIPDQGFYQCTSLKTVKLNDNLQRIGYYAFADCTELEYAEIPKSVTVIGTSTFHNDPNLTLGVWYGSYGYEYAKAQNIPYVLLDNALLGDANGDGVVNINDVTAIQRFKADMETLEGINLHAADVNGDGNVTIEDATVLQRYFAEYDDIPYSIGEVMTQ